MSSFDSNLADIRALDGKPQLTTTKSSVNKTADLDSTTTSTASSSFVDLSDRPRAAPEPTPDDLEASNSTITDATPSSTAGIFGSDIADSGIMFFTLSSIYGASAVMLGAFGAHGLKKRIADPGRVANWGTAAQYQLIHSVALLATTALLPPKAQRIPCTLFVAGMTMFSGSIYLLVLDPQRFKALGPVTPLGGLALIGGWIALGVVGRGRFVPKA